MIQCRGRGNRWGWCAASQLSPSGVATAFTVVEPTSTEKHCLIAAIARDERFEAYSYGPVLPALIRDLLSGLIVALVAIPLACQAVGRRRRETA